MRRTFSVASMGLGERERLLLRGVLAISKQRDPCFEPYQRDHSQVPDMVVVNADDPNALVSWHGFVARVGSKSAGIMLTTEARAEFRWQLPRTLGGRQLLAYLERVANELHGNVAPLAVDLAQSSEPISATATGAGKAIRALVVDDSLPVRIQMKTALANIAGQVDFAENGEEAFRHILAQRYDIVFLDVVLPGGYSGYQICKAIKERPDSRATPVIMLTSNSSPADRIKGKLAGCDTYLIKPVKQAVFEEVVKEFIGCATAA